MIAARVLAVLVLAPAAAVAQMPLAAPTPTVAELSLPLQPFSPFQAPPKRSAGKTIALHTAVGTGAGLVIGLLLSGASTNDDRSSVIVSWTALGAAAGLVSGVVTWLVGRERS